MGAVQGTVCDPMSSLSCRASPWKLLAALIMVIPLGFAAKLYEGPARAWVNDSLSGVFYEVFWCLLGALAFRRARARSISAAVLLGTSALEFTQLWHPPLLQRIRSTFIGVTVVGDTFVPSDFVYYAIGCVLGWWILRCLGRRAGDTPIRSSRRAAST